MTLAIVLDPSSIAIVGASENPDKIGGRPVDYLRRFGFRGRVFPINPNRTEVQGLPSYPSLEALPETPDVAIIAVPGPAAVTAIDHCAGIGVKVAIMMASGFGETEHGKAQERDMAASARARNLRIVGPNSQGLANFATGTVASFSSMYLEAPPQDGPVAVLSQSGAMSVVPYGILRGRGIGIRHSHATGNDCDVTAAELAATVAADPDIRVMLLYLESIASPEHLAETARIAHARNLPILALKPGRTPAGQAAARSHTGALANEDRVVDAFLRRHGIRRVADTAEMVDAVELYLKGWTPRGRRLVVISNSGATCVMAADAASAAAMPMPRLADATQTGLRAVLPSFAATANPVDITAALLTNSRLFSQILPIIAADPAADAFLIGVPVAGAAYDVPVFARDAAAFAAQTGKPLVIAAPQPKVAAAFAATGLPVFPYETQAVAALAGFIAHTELIAAVKAHPPTPPSPNPPASPQTRTLNEVDSLRRLHQAGIPIVPHRLCHDAEQACAALHSLGSPVALKACSPDITHKSELGLVHLNLSDAQTIRTAFESCRQTVLQAGLRFDGVLVAPMRRGRREMLLGANRDPVFGPVIIFGDGGKYVEALPDTVLLLPPIDPAGIQAAIDRLRIAPILHGIRGEPPMDLEALITATTAIAHLMHDDPTILSLDINPLLLGNPGEGVTALDAVVIQSQGPG